MREGQAGRLGEGSVVFDEGHEDWRDFLADFFEGMAALGGDDDDDFNHKRQGLMQTSVMEDAREIT